VPVAQRCPHVPHARAQQHFGLGVATQLVERERAAGTRRARIRMIRAQRALADLDRARERRFGIGLSPGEQVEAAEIVVDSGDLRMPLAEGRQQDRERFLVHAFRLADA